MLHYLGCNISSPRERLGVAEQSRPAENIVIFRLSSLGLRIPILGSGCAVHSKCQLLCLHPPATEGILKNYKDDKDQIVKTVKFPLGFQCPSTLRSHIIAFICLLYFTRYKINSLFKNLYWVDGYILIPSVTLSESHLSLAI